MKDTPVPAPESKRPWLSRTAIISWCLAVAALVIVFFLVYNMAQEAARSSASLCQGNLKLIHLSALVWAEERKTNQMPADFFSFTNEIIAPHWPPH